MKTDVRGVSTPARANRSHPNRHLGMLAPLPFKTQPAASHDLDQLPANPPRDSQSAYSHHLEMFTSQSQLARHTPPTNAAPKRKITLRSTALAASASWPR